MELTWKEQIRSAAAPVYLRSAVIEAISQLLERDHYLLKHAAHERSLTHRLAVYLEPGVAHKGWCVDCEYDKDGHDNRKRVHLPFVSCEERAKKRHHRDGSLVYPDIVVHRRGHSTPRDRGNLLAIEVKKLSLLDDCPDSVGVRDRAKLDCFRQQLGYQNTLFLCLSVGERVAEGPWVEWRSMD